MKIIVWSDFSSPECYVGQVRLQHVIKQLGMQREVTYEQRAYRMNVAAPLRSVETYAEKLAFDKGISLKQARDHFEHWTRLGETEDIKIDFGNSFDVNTLDAHRLVQWAQEKYQDSALIERLIDNIFKANFEDHLLLSNQQVLLQVAAESGLDEKGSQRVLESRVFEKAVLKQERHFRDLGQSGIPYYVINGHKLSGIQSRKVFCGCFTR